MSLWLHLIAQMRNTISLIMYHPHQLSLVAHLLFVQGRGFCTLVPLFIILAHSHLGRKDCVFEEQVGVD